jgi:hypothetical protein
MERILKGGGREAFGEAAPRTPFSKRFEEDSARWRLRHFLGSGVHAYEGAEFVTYRVSLREGKSEDDLYAHATGWLGGREFPPIMPEAAGMRAVEMFRDAEREGLVEVTKAHSSPRRQ